MDMHLIIIKDMANMALIPQPFKATLCQDQHYAAELVRYINLNPLRRYGQFSNNLKIIPGVVMDF